jgi:5-methyltetrahydrofolate--homocysteine methyltransferase
LGFAAKEARDPEAMLSPGYRGSRYSFGYLACPNLADQQQLLALLNAEEIGTTLSEEDQLDPSNRLPPSSSTTPRRNTSRCEQSGEAENFSGLRAVKGA